MVSWKQEGAPDRRDEYDFGRFVQAQSPSYATALMEMRRGAKRSHWMWFVFPQVAGLGSSDMARRFAIGGIEEARAYYAHPLLGERYRECVAVLQDLTGTTAQFVFGSVDAMKLRSSLTLFWRATDAPMVKAAIDQWFDGAPDEATIAILDRATRAHPSVERE